MRLSLYKEGVIEKGKERERRGRRDREEEKERKEREKEELLLGFVCGVCQCVSACYWVCDDMNFDDIVKKTSLSCTSSRAFFSASPSQTLHTPPHRHTHRNFCRTEATTDQRRIKFKTT
jgi:hypothetical protein